MDSVAVRLARGIALHEQCAEKAEPSFIACRERPRCNLASQDDDDSSRI